MRRRSQSGCAHFQRGGTVWRQPSVHRWTFLTESILKSILEPFTYGPWTNTDYCNETCGDNRFFLESRTCSLVSPNLPSNFSCQDQTTLRTGTTMCPPSVIDCAGNVKHHNWSISRILGKIIVLLLSNWKYGHIPLGHSGDFGNERHLVTWKN